MVDGKDYGQNIKFKDTSKFQVNLAPGKHECYLDVIPKDAAQKIYKSNLVVRIELVNDYSIDVQSWAQF